MVAAHTFVRPIKVVPQATRCAGARLMVAIGHHNMTPANRKAGFQLKSGILSDNSDKN